MYYWFDENFQGQWTLKNIVILKFLLIWWLYKNILFQIRINGRLIEEFNSNELNKLKKEISGELILFEKFAQLNPTADATSEDFLRAHQTIYPRLTVLFDENLHKNLNNMINYLILRILIIL